MPPACAAQRTVKVYAAASLTKALNDIGRQFNTLHPDVRVSMVFASSATLAQHIAAGAPADLFFSADEAWINYLVSQQQINATQVRRVLGNTLVIIRPGPAVLGPRAPAQFDFAQFNGKLCTAQTESVPAGRYARQSLIHLGWYPALKGHLVGTSDVRAALRLVERGECDAGIVYATDARISRQVQVVGHLPASSHQPIGYFLAPTRQASRQALGFLNYLSSSPYASTTFKRYGFNVYP